MKLSGLLWWFWFVPQRAVNVPREPPRWVRGSRLLRLTLRMFTKSCGNGPNASLQLGLVNCWTSSACGCGSGVAGGGAPASSGAAAALPSGGGAGLSGVALSPGAAGCWSWFGWYAAGVA